ncbi:MAG: 1-acyl-sn-glycerol-3-phosphate acyltransferase [Spirochaetales bacterium]|nr:1-acyl-sn-glycerol-3-phosphate acyltransferase [Candidatus Physcosoma equi]
MFRFVFLCALHIHYAILCTYWMVKALKKGNGLSLEERWKVARDVVHIIVREAKCPVEVHGTENLPSDSGYIIMPNHQGKFDGLAIVNTHEKPLSFVLDKKRADILMETYWIDLTQSERISKTNGREAFQTMKRVRDRVKGGETFCIFPEGGHNDNGNNLQEFHTGCFHFLSEMNCPIVPCVLVDSYRVFNYQKFWEWTRKVTVKVYYLPPIFPEEYKGLDKRAVAELVKSRIQKKLSEVC